jgi:hypothetical protein
VLIISISTLLFIHLTTQKKKKNEIMKKIPIDMQQERVWMVAKQKAHKQTDTK